MSKFVLSLFHFLLLYILPVIFVFLALPPDSETIKYQFISDECVNISGNIVIGDSRTEIGFLDSTSQYSNLSLGGSTPLEGYETLKKLDLSQIDTVIISYSYFHLFSQDCFYKRSLPSGYISKDTENELKYLINMYPNSTYNAFDKINLNSSSLERYLFFKRNGLFSPSRILTSIKFLLGLEIENINLEGGLGRTLYRTSNLCNQEKVTHELKVNSCPRDTAYFDPINKFYLEKISAILNPETQVYFIEWSRLNGAEDLNQEERNNYLNEIGAISPKINVIGSLIDLDCEYFFDADHLNSRGAELYTKLVKQTIRNKPTNIPADGF